jgi:glycosyltransferase involved in cell wall biosynthesis
MPRRILFVAHSALQGGAELCLDTLLRELDKAKYNLTVIFPQHGPMAESARALGARVEVWPLAWWMSMRISLQYCKNFLVNLVSVLRLVWYLKRHRIDLVYSNSSVVFGAAWAARIAGVPHVWHVHEVLAPGHMTSPVLPLRVIKRLIRSLSRRIIFESSSSQSAYLAGQEDDRTCVVYNCVRFAGLPRMGREAGRARLGIRSEDRVVAFVGRFSERKNPLLLVRAACRIADRTNVRFLFVGDGPLHQELLHTIAALGLSDCSHVVSFQEDITWVIELLDVLVLPSQQESFGMVLVEAAAYGKPTIATRTEGPREIVVDGVTGLLVEPNNDAELARKLEYLLGDEAIRRQMGKAAAQRAQDLFSASKYAHKIEQVIDVVLTGECEEKRDELASGKCRDPRLQRCSVPARGG